MNMLPGRYFRLLAALTPLVLALQPTDSACADAQSGCPECCLVATAPPLTRRKRRR